ncbi:MAG: hypothetical protein AB7P04_09945 [Bacteriovoracia bacterium]
MKNTQRKPLFQGMALLLTLATACTGQLPNSFRYLQQEQSFPALIDFNTKLDLLWVVDNSGSMEPVQQKLRQGFASFAQQYMKPTWDIRTAVIRSDTYLAHASFSNYINVTPISGTVVANGYASNYLNGIGANARSAPYTNQPWAPSLITWHAATSRWRGPAAGVKIKDIKPQLAQNYAKLLPGVHDGPDLSMCWEKSDTSNFMDAPLNCYRRDDPAQAQYGTGVERCLNPVGAQTSESQCVNTHMNNTVRSGKPIITTMPPAGVPGDQAWIDQLVKDFMVNASVSTMGSGSERSMQSVLQLLNDNESDPITRFFRPGSLRVVVFVGDEDDQSMLFDPNQSTPNSHYITSNAICRHTDAQGITYGPSDCPDPAWELPIGDFKDSLDGFFRTLDESGAGGDPNYFAVSIQRTTGTGTRGYRFGLLVDEVANGSLVMNVDSTDYAPLLEAIGLKIIEKKAQFHLTYTPDHIEWMIVKIIYANGTVYQVQPNQFTVNGRVLTITDNNLINGLGAGDSVSINYQPYNLE